LYRLQGDKKLPHVGAFQGFGSLLLSLILNKPKILSYLHTHQLSIRLEVSLQISYSCIDGIEVHNKQSLRRT
jgi:hypothetical protein